MIKPIVVCADDYSMDPGVCEGIVSLVRQGRVSATSVMVLSPSWKHDAQTLREVRDCTDVGLHLDFTSEFAVHYPLGQSLPKLMLKSAAGMLDSAKLSEMVSRQLDLFENHWNAAPDHVDGHQHVHQFPLIRDALLQECKKRYGNRMPWLRWSRPVGASSAIKGQIISAFGAKPLANAAKQTRMPLSGALLGVYDFDPKVGVYATHMQNWLALAQPGSLLMCHPSNGSNPSDAINPARQQECRYLMSEEFAERLSSAGCEVVRGSSVYLDYAKVGGLQA